MTAQHPTPSPEVVAEIIERVSHIPGAADPLVLKKKLVKAAYIAGANDELDACVDWVEEEEGIGFTLREARRPGRSPKQRLEDALEGLRREILTKSPGAPGVRGAAWCELERLIEGLPNG